MAICSCTVLVAMLSFLGSMLLDGNKIPKLYIAGNLSGLESKKDIRNISFLYHDKKVDISGYAEIKLQGTSSLAYEKKNYTIKFFSDEDHENKLKVDMGWGEQNKYCLKANWIDRTHARNVVSAKLVSQMQQKYGLLTEAPCNGAVDGFPVEIYINGDFHGLYTFNIPKDAWQFAMDEEDPDHIVICGEGFEPANLFEAEPDFSTWSVEVGEENEATLEKMKVLFDFVRNSTDEEFKEDFEKHLDLDAALNYYIFAEFAYLEDNRGKNMLLATYDGQVWYPSLYDLDTSWGSFYNGRALYDYHSEPMNMQISNLFRRMETCFAQELAQRYFELRQDVLSEEHIMEEFENFRNQIPQISFVKEAIRWGSGFIKRTEDLPGFDYDQIEEYLDTVIDGLDAKYMAILEK